MDVRFRDLYPDPPVSWVIPQPHTKRGTPHPPKYNPVLQLRKGILSYALRRLCPHRRFIDRGRMQRQDTYAVSESAGAASVYKPDDAQIQEMLGLLKV